MGKLTFRLIKYFLGIIAFISVVSLIASSIFLSIIYKNMEYSQLESASKDIYSALKSDNYKTEMLSEYNVSSAALFKTDGTVQSLTTSKMGINSIVKNLDISTLEDKGKYEKADGEEFIYYKYATDIGTIIVLENYQFSAAYLQTTYVSLIMIFGAAIIISVPLVAYFGRKLTVPIIELEKASIDITKGNYNFNVEIDTKDEIEELSKSLKFMAKTIETKNEMQRNFIANVSHDFKTPLSVIRGYTEALRDDLVDEKDKKSFYEDMISEVDRLNVLVMDILQLSKLQGGKNLLKMQDFNLSELIYSFQNKFGPLAVAKDIKINISVYDDKKIVHGDPDYLYRVIYNFLDNAIKFSQPEGEVKLTAVQFDEGVKISVIDNGRGINADYIKDIWDRYYTDEKSGGMGIGLAICREILELHGFKYGAQSEPGVRTEFYFVIGD